jgi:hypothetical protein
MVMMRFAVAAVDSHHSEKSPVVLEQRQGAFVRSLFTEPLHVTLLRDDREELPVFGVVGPKRDD